MLNATFQTKHFHREKNVAVGMKVKFLRSDKKEELGVVVEKLENFCKIHTEGGGEFLRHVSCLSVMETE